MTNIRTITHNGEQLHEFDYGSEVLRSLKHYPDYWASDAGHIWSTKTKIPKLLKAIFNKRIRIWYVNLYRPDRHWPRKYPDGQIRMQKQPQVSPIHTLVASVWLPAKPTPAHEVDHIDENRANNRATNLRWLTKFENGQAYRENHPEWMSGERNHSAKLTEAEVRVIHTLRGKLTSVEVGEMYGVYNQTICKIWLGRTWRHLLPTQS